MQIRSLTPIIQGDQETDGLSGDESGKLIHEDSLNEEQTNYASMHVQSLFFVVSCHFPFIEKRD